MKFLPGTDPAIIQQHLDKWNRDIKIAPVKAASIKDQTLVGETTRDLNKDGTITPPTVSILPVDEPGRKPKAYTSVMTDQRSTLTDWSPKNQSGADLWESTVKDDIADKGFNPTAGSIIHAGGATLEKAKSFIPGANATGVRMARSAASRTGAGLTGTDQFKQQRTGEGLTPREPRQGHNLDPTVHDQNLKIQGRNKFGRFEIPNTGVGTGERWSGRGLKNILQEEEYALQAKKNQQNLLINKR